MPVVINTGEGPERLPSGYHLAPGANRQERAGRRLDAFAARRPHIVVLAKPNATPAPPATTNEGETP